MAERLHEPAPEASVIMQSWVEDSVTVTVPAGVKPAN